MSKTTAAGSGDDVREGFFARILREANQINALITAGHLTLCAERQVWGDGACDCGRPGDGKTWRHVRTEVQE